MRGRLLLSLALISSAILSLSHCKGRAGITKDQELVKVTSTSGAFTHAPHQDAGSVATLSSQLPKDSLVLHPNEGLVYHKDEPFTGTSVEYYPNGLMAATIDYKAGKRDGYQRKWFINGLLSFESNYRAGKLHGYSRSWWSNGRIRSESYLEEGVGQGLQRQWYVSGSLFKATHLKDGHEEGLQQAWRENGKIYNNYEARNGRIFGLKRANLCYSLEDEEIQFAD